MSESEDLLDPGVSGGGVQVSGVGTLPNAVATLVLGIISIVGCIFYGVPGLICGIIALALHRKDKALYQANPMKYEVSYKTAKAGQVCAIIGTSLSGAFFLFAVIAIFAAVSSGPGF